MAMVLVGLTMSACLECRTCFEDDMTGRFGDMLVGETGDGPLTDIGES